MADEKGATAPSHHEGARKGEEIVQEEGVEAGRHHDGSSGADRPTGGSTSRDSTRINPDKAEPIDDESPHLPPA